MLSNVSIGKGIPCFECRTSMTLRCAFIHVSP